MASITLKGLTKSFPGGDSVEVLIRPTIRLDPLGGGPRAGIGERTFLENIIEYDASLDSGPTLRVQSHPAQVFAIGDTAAVVIDGSQCSFSARIETSSTSSQRIVAAS